MPNVNNCKMLKPLVKELMVSLNFFSIGDIKDNRLDGYMVKKLDKVVPLYALRMKAIHKNVW